MLRELHKEESNPGITEAAQCDLHRLRQSLPRQKTACERHLGRNGSFDFISHVGLLKFGDHLNGWFPFWCQFKNNQKGFHEKEGSTNKGVFVLKVSRATWYMFRRLPFKRQQSSKWTVGRRPVKKTIVVQSRCGA